MNALQVAERSAACALQSAAPSIIGEAFDLMVTAPQGVVTLRKLILSLAVQGKLVAQSRRDEPASTLIARLDQIRRKMVAAGAIRDVKNEAAPESHRDTDRLPDGWIVASLSNLAWPQAGFAFKSSNFNDTGNGLPLIRIRDVGANAPRTFFSGEYRDEFLVQSGDWLIGMDGDFRIERWTGPKALLNQRVTRLIFFGEVIQPLYVCIALQQALRRLQGTKAYTTVDHLSGKQIASRPIPLPPLAEQRRIVARVEELMGLCDKLEAHGRLQDEQHAQLVSTLFDALVASASPEELAANWQRVASHFDLLLDRPEAIDALEQTILQLAVRGLLATQDARDESASQLLVRIRAEKARLVVAGKIKRDKPQPAIKRDEAPYQIPASRQWVRFGDVVNRSQAGWSPGCEGSPRRSDAWGVLKVSAVSWGKFRSCENKQLPKGLKPRPEYEVRDGDFLLSRANTEELVARSVVAKNPEPRLMLSDKIIRLDVSALVSRDFLNMVNNTKASRSYYAANASGTSSSMKNVGREVILNMPIPLPPLAEQHRIVARAEELRVLCADLRKRLREARATQSNLGDALVTTAVA